MFQLLMRLPERPGAKPAPWTHGMVGTSTEVWNGMMMARRAGLICMTKRTTTAQAPHSLFEEGETVDVAMANADVFVPNVLA